MRTEEKLYWCVEDICKYLHCSRKIAKETFKAAEFSEKEIWGLYRPYENKVLKTTVMRITATE